MLYTVETRGVMEFEPMYSLPAYDASVITFRGKK